MIVLAQEILALFQKYGHLTYGEGCTVQSHSFQAGCLARAAELDEELELAAYLHDIGHLYPLALDGHHDKMAAYGIQNHEDWGAQFLEERGFSKRIVATVKNHVAAKRYLCQADPDYFSQLSEASRQTMVFQGGIMSVAEAEAFKQHPFFTDIIAIRKLDEAAKGTHFTVQPAHWERLFFLVNKHFKEQHKLKDSV